MEFQGSIQGKEQSFVLKCVLVSVLWARSSVLCCHTGLGPARVFPESRGTQFVLHVKKNQHDTFTNEYIQMHDNAQQRTLAFNCFVMIKRKKKNKCEIFLNKITHNNDAVREVSHEVGRVEQGEKDTTMCQTLK